jgi:hypothetical protein
VPIYPVVITVPPGYRVQDVQMTRRSDPLGTQGLILPINVAYTDTLQAPQMAAAQAALQDLLASSSDSGLAGWLPQADFTWDAVPNNDGSTSLNLTLFPFYYNPLTTDVRFHRNYTFAIRYSTPGISLTWFTTDKAIYDPGQQVQVEIGLTSEEPMDVVVEATVHRAASDQVVDGLLLQTLTGLSGPASFATTWDSRDFAPGDYDLRVTLRDASGDLLDQATRSIRLGTVQAEVTALSAQPSPFELGQPVHLSIEVKNTGAVELSGSAVIEVRHPGGQILQHFEHPFSSLQPNGTRQFTDTWDTTGVAPGTYTVLGEVHYESAVASTSLTITAAGGSQAFLPIITKGAKR